MKHVRLHPVIRGIARATAARRKTVGAVALLTGFLGIAMFKAQGRISPTAAQASGESPVTTASPAPTLTTSAAFQGWLRAPVPAVGRNLFYINREQFPRTRPAQGAAMPGANALVGAGSPSELRQEIPDAQAKSPAERSEDPEEPDIDFPMSPADRAARQAARLHLQSVIMGPTPRALIDGQLLGENDVVANFRVLKIEARGITLEREGIKLEVLFKK